MPEIASFIIGKVADILPTFLLRLIFPVSKVARQVTIDLQGEDPISPMLNADIPRIDLRLKITNLSHLNLVLDRLLIDLWFGQPTLRGALLNRYRLAAASFIDNIHFVTDLTAAQKTQIDAYISSPSSSGTINLHVTAYFESKVGMLEVQQTFERRKL